MKRVLIPVAAAGLLASGVRTMAGSADAANLPSHPNPPDPLVMLDGQPVATKQEWVKRRRPELKALFQHYMYGTFPPPARVHGKVTYTDAGFLEGKATLKLVTLKFGPAGTPETHLMMVLPNQRAGAAPVFLGMNFYGNHTLVTETNVPLPTGWMSPEGPHVVNHRAAESGRGTLTNDWDFAQCVGRGYAVATFYCGDVQPDDPGAAGGVRQTVHVPAGAEDWGTIAAWAWGLQRAVDYLAKDNDIDKKRIALVGHSRLGKTALLAGAFDERVAMVIALQAGCGGTAPSRGKVGETVEQINTGFPHWFCVEFKKFNTHPDRLPFDQNCLIALCAPRPVLLGAAVEDTWANPAGAFEMLKEAGPVYRLLGAEGLSAPTMPGTNELIDSTLGFFIRPGQHSMTPEDWKYFLDFADKRWKG
jgi:hypothetical protein